MFEIYSWICILIILIIIIITKIIIIVTIISSNWWPMFVLIFYATSPIPSTIARRYADSVETSSVLIEVCLFITTGIVISAYGLPIVLAHLHVVSGSDYDKFCGLLINTIYNTLNRVICYGIIHFEQKHLSVGIFMDSLFSMLWLLSCGIEQKIIPAS